MLQEQLLKDLQHQWRAEMLQGHKTWKNETAGRTLQPSELYLLHGVLTREGGSQGCFKAAHVQAALKYPLPRATLRGRHV